MGTTILAVFLIGCDNDTRTEPKEVEDEVKPSPQAPLLALEAPKPKVIEPAQTHENIVEEFIAWKWGFLDALTKVSDSKGAEEFLESLPERKKEMRELLKTARGLPAPATAAKTHYQTLNEDFADKSSQRMDEFLAGARSGAGASVIRDLFKQLSEDEEAEVLKEEFEAFYR